ncbi:MAG: polymer-forming cytoskeletal protein [Bacteroidota bacterium]
MFGSSNKDTKKTETTSARSSTPSRGLNTVNEGTVMTGDLTAENDIRIDGSIKGNLDCKAKVIIGPKGSIDGEVICVNAMIEGHFNGKLTVKEMLSIKETAKVTGNVITRKVAMMAGCDFEGTVTTRGGKGNTNGQRPAGNKVAALKAKEGVKA